MKTNSQTLKQFGISQQTIADRLGIGKAAVNQAVHGLISSQNVWREIDKLAKLPSGTAEANALAERTQRKGDIMKRKKVKSPLRARRLALGMLQSELAKALAVKAAAVSRWEVHGVASIRTAMRLADFFHCDWKELIDVRNNL